MVQCTHAGQLLLQKMEEQLADVLPSPPLWRNHDMEAAGCQDRSVRLTAPPGPPRVRCSRPSTAPPGSNDGSRPSSEGTVKICSRGRSVLYKTADRTIFFAVITLTTAAARRKFSELVNRVWYTKERATLTRYGQPLVAVVPVEDLEILDGNSDRRLGRKAKTVRTTKQKAVITRYGQPRVAIVPVEDLFRLGSVAGARKDDSGRKRFRKRTRNEP